MSVANVLFELAQRAAGANSFAIGWCPTAAKYAIRVGGDPSALVADSLFYIRTDGANIAQVLYTSYGAATTYTAIDLTTLATLITNSTVLANFATFITAMGGTAFMAGATSAIPADAATGYRKNTIYFATDGTTLDNSLFINIGDHASANFDAFKGTS